MRMKASTCTKNSTAMRRKKRQEKALEDGNFEGALGYQITIVATETVQVEIIFNKPGCCIKRPKKKES